MMMNFGPTTSRVRRTIASGKRIRLRNVLLPFVVAPVGMRGDELVDEIALGAHDLNSVVAGPLRALRAAGESGDRPSDSPVTQCARTKRRNRRLNGRRRDRKRVVGIAPGVQDLQRDLAADVMYRVGDDAVPADLPGKRELRCAWLQTPPEVRRDTAGNDQSSAAFRPRRIKGRKLVKPVRSLFEPGVH